MAKKLAWLIREREKNNYKLVRVLKYGSIFMNTHSLCVISSKINALRFLSFWVYSLGGVRNHVTFSLSLVGHHLESEFQSQWTSYAIDILFTKAHGRLSPTLFRLLTATVS